MKKLFIFLIIVLATFFFWPVQPESQLHTAREQFYEQCRSVSDSILATSISEEDKTELLHRKNEELQAYEDVLIKINNDIARQQAEVVICPITGLPNQLIIQEDPRPELQEKVYLLREEIRTLESNS